MSCIIEVREIDNFFEDNIQYVIKISHGISKVSITVTDNNTNADKINEFLSAIENKGIPVTLNLIGLEIIRDVDSTFILSIMNDTDDAGYAVLTVTYDASIESALIDGFKSLLQLINKPVALLRERGCDRCDLGCCTGLHR
jgi:heptaprenylglyceryl phosphate synthase